MAENDLSPYEQARLENIQKNQALLASLGLARASAAQAAESVAVSGRPAKKARKEPRLPSLSTRRSSRLAGKDASDDSVQAGHAENIDGDGQTSLGVSVPPMYSDMPLEALELDPHEFQVFVILRRWRLRRKNELQIEPYKVAQTRSLCEVIRRRRNNPKWATVDPSSELLQVWGLGPAKVKLMPPGFGHEMLAVVSSPECTTLLEKSRKLGDGEVPAVL
eukprot:m.44272 g.44272  ORF g.44272 m.44272 type:complete len:220 (+) comp8513_c0_seq1:650-1309(+)